MSESAPMAEFMGRARLFPLPNLVFFPHVMQPLHIFEPRYRQLTADALDGDRFIALVLPLPGWEKDYESAPELHSVACLGRIVAEQRLEDGRFNILLRGQARIRIVKEIAAKKLYRMAQADILDDVPIDDEAVAAQWRQTLEEKAPTWFAAPSEIAEQFAKLLSNDLPLGILCDILAFALPLDAGFKQSLLEELNVETRLRTLHDFLEASKAVAAKSQRTFPPEFSPN
ncbi:MAG: LON peptidase substrate-binding domain-containing protein [Planctomycetes bacterium]|nr:LON peptidase substrate-binding domain-containing protein [Planctomycetota bacterium]